MSIGSLFREISRHKIEHNIVASKIFVRLPVFGVYASKIKIINKCQLLTDYPFQPEASLKLSKIIRGCDNAYHP